MAILEYWVDPVSGNNANAGTAAAPFAELRYATSTVIASARGVSDTVIINVVPSAVLDSLEQYIRLDAGDWTGGKLIVRSSQFGVPWRIGATGVRLIWAIGACDADVVIEDCHATTRRIMEWAGLTVSSATGVRLTLRDGCVFTHSVTTGEGVFNFDADSQTSSLYIEPGVVFEGWSSIGNSNNLRECLIDGIVFDSVLCDGSSTSMSADVLRITNSTFKINRVVNNVFSVRSLLTLLEFSNNVVEMQSSNSSDTVTLVPPATGVSSVVCICKGNKITAASPSQSLMIGAGVNASLTRAANDATYGTFASIDCSENEIVQLNNAGGCIRVMIGTTNAVIESNYIRRGVLRSGTNVHVVYLYGAGITFRNNDVMGQVLAFGPDQKVCGNTIVDSNIAILLGGTQGGSQAIGGGNNYLIANNTFASYGDSNGVCFNDYAYNGAYPTNLGTLVCASKSNVYIPLDGAPVARLTAAGTFINTLSELQSTWDSWGDASNANNDHYSFVANAALSEAVQTVVESASNVLLPSDFETIRTAINRYVGDYAREKSVQSIIGLIA